MATDTKVVSVSDIFQKSKITKNKIPSLLQAFILLVFITISLNFYYQIIVLGIQDMEAFWYDSQQAAMFEEGIKICTSKGFFLWAS